MVCCDRGTMELDMSALKARYPMYARWPRAQVLAAVNRVTRLTCPRLSR